MLLSLCGPQCRPPRRELADAQLRRDPTKTIKVRAKMRREADDRWRVFSRSLREALIQHDIIGMRGIGRLPHADKTEGFSVWLEGELRHKVLGYNGSWLAPYIDQAARIAQAHVEGYGLGGLVDPGRVASMKALAVSELKGIVEAARQQLTRVASQGIATNGTPTQLANALAGVIRTMRTRTEAMCEYMVAKTHAAGSLSAFKSSGVSQVGILPEHMRRKRTVTDSQEDISLDGLYEQTAALVAKARVDQSYQVKELANRNPDGDIVFIDEHVPEQLKCGILPKQTLPWHELSEWILMNLGLPYDRAHRIATLIERRRVEELIPGAWDEYQEEMGGLIADAEERGFTDQPPDQDMRVFDKLVPARGPIIDAKVSKASVNYRPSTGDERCGDCAMFRGDVCTLVEGEIDGGYVCDDWADASKWMVPDAAGEVGEESIPIKEMLARAKRRWKERYAELAEEFGKGPAMPRLEREMKAESQRLAQSVRGFRGQLRAEGNEFIARRKVEAKATEEARRQIENELRERYGRESGIVKAERAKEKLETEFGETGVDVITAGDEDVCEECEQIAAEGPYSIDEAQGLIPAHNWCRCAFAPAGKYEKDAARDYSPNQPRDPQANTRIVGSKAIADVLLRDEFIEEDHPRAPNGSPDGGQFVGSGEAEEQSEDPSDKYARLTNKMPRPDYKNQDNQDVLERYMGSGYRNINGSLKRVQGDAAKLSAPARRDVDRLDSMINKSSLAEDVTVSRGMILRANADPDTLVGRVMGHYGYTSTSVLPSVGSSFARSAMEREIEGSAVALVEMKLKAGSKALIGDRGEGELILPRGGQFKIVSAERTLFGNLKGVIRIRAEYVGTKYKQ